MERDYEFTSKCHLDDISSPSELGKNAAEQTIKKLNPKKIGSDKLSIIFDKRISKGFLSSICRCNIRHHLLQEEHRSLKIN
jgi:PmbA protein